MKFKLSVINDIIIAIENASSISETALLPSVAIKRNHFLLNLIEFVSFVSHRDSLHAEFNMQSASNSRRRPRFDP